MSKVFPSHDIKFANFLLSILLIIYIIRKAQMCLNFELARASEICFEQQLLIMHISNQKSSTCRFNQKGIIVIKLQKIEFQGSKEKNLKPKGSHSFTPNQTNQNAE